MKNKLVFAFCFLLLFSSLTFAASIYQGGWTSGSAGDYGFNDASVAAGSNAMYIAGNNGAVYKNVIGESTWTQLTAPTIDAIVAINAKSYLAADVRTTSLYVLTSNFLYKSDGSSSFTGITVSSTDKTYRDMSFINTLEGWVLSQNNIYKTTDGGATFSLACAIPSTSSPNKIFFTDAHHGWTVGIATDGAAKINFTTDGGSTWATAKSVSGAVLNDIFFVNPTYGWAAGNSGYILRATAGGGTDDWTQVGSGATTANLNRISAVTSTEVWAAGAGGLIMRSLNGGVSWIEQADSARTISILGLDFLGAGIPYGVAVGEIGSAYTYNLPTLVSALPSTIIQGEANKSVAITGTNFEDTATLRTTTTGVTIVSSTVESATAINAVISTASTTTVGGCTLIVTNPDGTLCSSESIFSVKGPGPAISNVKLDGVAVVAGSNVSSSPTITASITTSYYLVSLEVSIDNVAAFTKNFITDGELVSSYNLSFKSPYDWSPAGSHRVKITAMELSTGSLTTTTSYEVTGLKSTSSQSITNVTVDNVTTSGSLNLSYALTSDENAVTIFLRDPRGVVIGRRTYAAGATGAAVGANAVSIAFPEVQATGVYFYTILQGNTKLTEGKFVIAK